MHSWSGPLSTIIILATVVLTACGGAAPAASSPPTPSKAASAAASATPGPSSAPAKPAASAGAAASKPAASGPIKIGVLEPLTGGFANLGKDNQDALNLYLASIHDTVAGRKVELHYADDQAQADVGLIKAKGLVGNENVKALMGITLTPVAYAVASYVKQAHVPLMITENGGAQALLTNPKFKSPYVTRFTQSQTVIMDPPADWAYNHGWRKAIVMAGNYGAGLENVDAFASTFIKHGGSIVQEQYPPLGTTDFGPYFAQLDKSADFIQAFFPGIDGLRFIQQIGNYTAQRKLPILDTTGSMTSGPNLAVEKDKAVGVFADNNWSSGLDTPENTAFLTAWGTKYPGRLPSVDAAMGWASGQILQAALEKVHGNVEDTQAFLNALYATNVTVPKGPIKLDANHDVVENLYIYQIVKQGGGYGQKVLHTYKNVSANWDRTPQEIEHFPFGKLKDKWVGMTKDKLAQLSKG